ncbi:DUF2244 domain-containing protein [Marinobacter sp. F3R08]|uniref:DUF2244 domain-containing protein n=1 Tax=Marinobacter sp. F3R08 TaxID=2841559 RepID=UPI001C0A37F0|nr:DUF2244 domain-containing protein [Marinobacter sp. F3R08]MBU2953828.1 DUF2244 domain-containing protein [Marinobacter sp. F3R08]
MVERLPHPGGLRLVLTPNRSLSWHGNVRIWMGLFVLSALIATGFTLMGAWVIIPFAGLELIALACGIYLTSQACQRQEVLSIDGDDIHLEKGRKRKQQEWSLPTRYTRLQIHSPSHPFTPARLSLSHRDTEVSIGTFLNIEDTGKLIEILERKGLRIERKEPDPNIGLWF